MYWLALLGLVGIMVTIIVRASDDEPEYILKAKEVEKMDNALRRRKQYV